MLGYREKCVIVCHLSPRGVVRLDQRLTFTHGQSVQASPPIFDRRRAICSTYHAMAGAAGWFGSAQAKPRASRAGARSCGIGGECWTLRVVDGNAADGSAGGGKPHKECSLGHCAAITTHFDWPLWKISFTIFIISSSRLRITLATGFYPAWCRVLPGVRMYGSPCFGSYSSRRFGVFRQANGSSRLRRYRRSLAKSSKATLAVSADPSSLMRLPLSSWWQAPALLSLLASCMR